MANSVANLKRAKLTARQYDRFLAKRGQPDANGCTPWLGKKNADGYGKHGTGLRGDKTRRQVGAHRIAWLLWCGPITKRKPCICHTCDNPQCSTPEHLFDGTHKDNMDDMNRKGRAVAGHKRGGLKVRGEGHGVAKLTDDKVIAMRARHVENHRALAREFGVHVMTVNRVIRRAIWKHI